MKKISKILLLLIVFSLFIFSLSAYDKWAVIVGVNDYKHPRINDLRGCVNDANEAKQMLINKYGFSEANIVLLTDAEAKRQNIIDSLTAWLPNKINSGDIVVFYYSGHGSNANDDNGDEADGLDETLVPSDRATTDNQGKRVPDIRDDELAAAFKVLREKGALITVVLDSCHSGTGIRTLQGRPTAGIRFAPPINWEGRAIDSCPSSRDYRSGDEEVVMDGVWLFAGCRANQTSLEYRIAGEFHGLMSYFLMKGLGGGADNNSDNQITYDELWKYSSEEVKKFISEQMHSNHEQDVQLETKNPQAVLFQGLTTQPPPPTKRLTIKGAVLDSMGRRVPNALVGFVPLGKRDINRDTLITYARTDEQGTFVAVNPIEPGTYTIKVVCQGYKTLWQDIVVSESDIPGVTFVKIVMERE